MEEGTSDITLRILWKELGLPAWRDWLKAWGITGVFLALGCYGTNLGTFRGTKDKEEITPHKYRATMSQAWHIRANYGAVRSAIQMTISFPGYYFATMDKETLPDDQFQEQLNANNVAIAGFTTLEDAVQGRIRHK